VLAQPILTVYAVVATANHFWLDCVAAAGLVLLVVAALNWWGRRKLGSAAPAEVGPGSASARTCANP